VSFVERLRDDTVYPAATNSSKFIAKQREGENKSLLLARDMSDLSNPLYMCMAGLEEA
jgi:hypothetical protein